VSKVPRPDERWWEVFAAQLVPPAQKEIIDTLKGAANPLSEVELSEAVQGGNLGPRITHHLRRLRKLNAVDIEVSGKGPPRVKYRLTRRPGRETE
jgi:DNA-binding HxlR family transcriptional regulator